MAERMVKVAFTAEEEQFERLKALSKKTRVPAAVYLREGLERVLQLAEKQQRSAEVAAQAAEESSE
jgi:predicted DNA-binding protein